MSARNRKLGTMTRADLGKHITFQCECVQSRHVEGTLRAFTHGIFSHANAGKIDVPRVMVTVRAFRSLDTHWATPDTTARILTQIGDTE